MYLKQSIKIAFRAQSRGIKSDVSMNNHIT